MSLNALFTDSAFEGERFSDGRELLRVSDQTFRSPGKIAFWTKADSVTHSNPRHQTTAAGRRFGCPTA